MANKINKTPKGAKMVNPTENIIIDEDNTIDVDSEFAEELA